MLSHTISPILTGSRGRGGRRQGMGLSDTPRPSLSHEDGGGGLKYVCLLSCITKPGAINAFYVRTIDSKM